MTETPSTQHEHRGVGQGSFGSTFWLLTTMEMWERLACHGMGVVIPVYIMRADGPGGLRFTAADKGTIFAIWIMVQSLLPMFTSGYADRYGYQKTIAVSISIKIAGYLLMAAQRTFFGFTKGAATLPAGTAIFTP